LESNHSFVTDLPVGPDTVVELAACGPGLPVRRFKLGDLTGNQWMNCPPICPVLSVAMEIRALRPG